MDRAAAGAAGRPGSKNARLLELQQLLQQEPARTRQCHIWQRTMLAAWCDRKLFPREAALHEAAKRLTATTGASSRPQHTASLTATWSSVSDISDEDISRAARRRDTPLEALQRYWKLLRQRRIWTLVVACLIFLIAGAVPSQTALLFSQLVCSEKGYSERQCVDQKNMIPATDADAIQAKASTMLAWANTATTTVAIFTSLLLSRASDFYGAKSSAPDIDGPEPACLEFLAYFPTKCRFCAGRKMGMLIGIACAVVGCLALGLVHSLPLLVACSVFCGSSGHGMNDIFLICIYSSIADVTTDHPTDRTLGFAIVSICYSTASILGPVGAGGLTHLLTPTLGYIGALRATFLVVAAVYAALGVFVLLVLRESVGIATRTASAEIPLLTRWKQIARDGNPVTMLWFLGTNRVLLMVAAVFAISHFAMSGTSGVEKLFQEYLFSWEALEQGYVSSASSIVSVGSKIVVLPLTVALFGTSLSLSVLLFFFPNTSLLTHFVWFDAGERKAVAVIFVLAAGGYCSYAMAGLPSTVALSRDARITLYLIGAIVGRLFWLAIGAKNGIFLCVFPMFVPSLSW